MSDGAQGGSLCVSTWTLTRKSAGLRDVEVRCCGSGRRQVGGMSGPRGKAKALGFRQYRHMVQHASDPLQAGGGGLIWLTPLPPTLNKQASQRTPHNFDKFAPELRLTTGYHQNDRTIEAVLMMMVPRSNSPK